MLSPKQLLINCVTLLCLEHRDGVATSPSNALVNQIIEALPIPESTIDHDHSRQTFLELRSTLLWLNSRSEDNFPGETEVLQQIQVACREETYLYEAVMTAMMEKHEDVKDTVRMIQSYRNKLTQHLTDDRIVSIIKDIHHRFVFQRGKINDVVEEVSALGEQLEPLINARTRQKHPAMMGGMDFSDPEELAAMFEDVKVNMSTEGAFQMGWKGLNRMLGKVGAVRRGEFVLVGGLQHHFKSGFMLSMFTHAALFNKPHMRDKTRKPLIYFITFENEVSDNLLWIYKYLKENDEGVAVVDAEVDPKEAASYVSERLRESGFEIKMDRIDPSDFTYSSLIATLDKLYADGYEIQMLITDYLNMISKSGIDAKVAGDDIRLLFRRVRNYTAPRGIAFISPHQLSSDAQQLTRENVEDFVKTVAGKGYYDGCRRLGQEPDLEIMIHKVVINGQSYLTAHRGKHRNANQTPEKDQYLVLPFKEIGTIPWDIDKDYDIALAAPGGGEIGSEFEDPWWNV